MSDLFLGSGSEVGVECVREMEDRYRVWPGAAAADEDEPEAVDSSEVVCERECEGPGVSSSLDEAGGEGKGNEADEERFIMLRPRRC